MKRILAALALALLATFATAATTVQDRSPFAQGLWWDPNKPGSGFDLFSAAGQVMVIWYTYDAAGQPVWYTAQGAQGETGNVDWPLYKFRWNGSAAEPTQVGTIRLSIGAPESATIKWSFDNASGTIAIAPFIQSGMVNEVDDTGTWFDPAKPGWGLSVLDQGEVLGAALYFYDPSGAPTWLAGFGRSSSIVLTKSSGACPDCPYRTPSASYGGALSFDWKDDSQITLHASLDVPMAAGIAVDGKRMSQLSRPASTRPADRQLARFDAASLRDFLARGLMSVPYFSGYSSTSPFSAAPPGASSGTAFSPTNLQEAGVDEAGLVKSDGRRVFTYDYASSQRLAAIRVAQVAPDGSSASLLGTVPIADGKAASVQQAGLVVYGDKLVSVHGSQAFVGYWPMASGSNWTGGRTQVEVLDLSGSGLPVSRWKVDFDGYIVATRRIGGMLYIVSRFTPSLPGFAFGTTDPAVRVQNQARIDAAGLAQLLPSLRLDASTVVPLVAADKTYLPPEGTRLKMADLVTVTAIDLDALAVRDTLTIAGSVETVYASSTTLVVATSRWDTHAPTTGTYLPEPPFARTDVHLVRLGAQSMSVIGSGTVEGAISASADQAPFRISEYGGRVRIVTSNMNYQWGPAYANRLTVVEPSAAVPGTLKTVAWLPNAQRPDSLGKPRETLHATRFVGDRLYAVTFKKIDPLYVLDLSAPADPRIAGMLEMPGFADYLHPLPDGLLLGFGKDAIPAAVTGDADFAWYQGLLVSLYDVSDAAHPAEKQRVLIGRRGSNSALLDHHHAFSELQLAPGRLAFSIPGSVNDGAPMYSYASDPNSTYYPWQYSGLLRFELQGTTRADTKIVPLPPLVTHTAASPTTYAPYPDAGSAGGRSVMFMKGTVYVGYGKFWHRDDAGTVTGPF